jgi:hypothetical protein
MNLACDEREQLVDVMSPCAGPKIRILSCRSSEITDAVFGCDKTEESDDFIEEKLGHGLDGGIESKVIEIEQSTECPRKVSTREHLIDTMELLMTMCFKIDDKLITIMMGDTRGGEVTRGRGRGRVGGTRGGGQILVIQVSCRKIHKDMIL